MKYVRFDFLSNYFLVSTVYRSFSNCPLIVLQITSRVIYIFPLSALSFKS